MSFGANAGAWRKFAGMAAVLILSVMANGCTRFEMPLPGDFVEVERSEEALKALTSEEDKLLVRHRAVQHQGNLEFWANAVRENLVDERGHTLIEESDIQSESGLPGHRLVLETSLNEVPYRNLLVLYVTESDWPQGLAKRLDKPQQHIYTIEFVAEKKNFEKHAEAVEKATRQFVPNRGHVMVDVQD